LDNKLRFRKKKRDATDCPTGSQLRTGKKGNREEGPNLRGGKKQSSPDYSRRRNGIPRKRKQKARIKSEPSPVMKGGGGGVDTTLFESAKTKKQKHKEPETGQPR